VPRGEALARGPDIVAEVRQAGDLAALGRDWRALEARSEASFFQSWSWIGTWLECLPADRRPDILALRRLGEIVGLAALGRRTERRHGVLAAHGLYLNETGDPVFDCLTVEYNGVLADPEGASDIARAAIGHLVQGVAGWDEAHLSGVPATGAIDYAALVAEFGLSVRTLARSDCRYVDLARIRAEGGAYLERVSANTRYQVRRALRRYAARGKVALTVAQNADESLARFDELKRLHQAAWTARGEPGSFANPFFEKFHRALIARTAGTGETQLVRVAAGEATVGILYNFAWRGRIHAYQSGFAYESDNAVKPGLVSHALAIDHAIASGADIYDFMAGEAQHKASLATDSLALAWLAARRPVAKYRIEDALRAAKRRLRWERSA